LLPPFAVDSDVYPCNVNVTPETVPLPPVTVIVEGYGEASVVPELWPEKLAIEAAGPPVQVTVPDPGVHVTARATPVDAASANPTTPK
jgi:hypothetical protein